MKNKYLYEKQLSNLTILIIQRQIFEANVSLQDITAASELYACIFLKHSIMWDAQLLPYHKQSAITGCNIILNGALIFGKPDIAYPHNYLINVTKL
jgi:hypothetical protein